MALLVPVPAYTGGTSVRYMRHYQYYPTQTTVVLGTLPEDFLRIPHGSPPYTNYGAQHGIDTRSTRQPLVGSMQITFVSASLRKNYGISRMDPYVRMRYGNHVYETPTCNNGAKTPYWNKTFHIYNPRKDWSLGIEIYDERTLTEDELIAWTRIEIPETVWANEPADQWFNLSGKSGAALEGNIKVRLLYTVGPPPAIPPVMVMPSYGSVYAQTMPVYTLPPPAYPVNSYTAGMSSYPTGVAQPPIQPQQPLREDDIKQLMEMFPKMDRSAIVSVLESSRGDKGSAINILLEM